MANELMLPMNQYLATPEVSKYLTQLLGERKGHFIVAMTTMVNGAKTLAECDRKSLTAVGLTAVGMNLSMSPSLGHCYAVPYRNKDGSLSAQFQMGWKGLIQLALRTGQYKFINVSEVYQNQFISWDKFNERLNADFTIEGEGRIVGYVAKFVLTSGFEKTIYWKTETIEAHGQKYSKTYDNGQWTKDFDGMARKTMIKQLISKFGLMSTELEEAIAKDQAILEVNYETGEEAVRYEDNPQNNVYPVADADGTIIADAVDVTPEPVKTKVEKANAGDYVIRFGNKHNGRTIRHIYEVDKGYLEWYAKWEKAQEPTLGMVKHYLAFPDVMKKAAPAPVQQPADDFADLPFTME